MSRTTIRAAITAWLQPPAVVGINKAFPGMPAVIDGRDFFAGSVGAGSGCVATVFIGPGVERRIAVGGAHGGWKRVDYKVTIKLWYRNVANAPLGTDKGLVSIAEFDTIVDNLKARIRADRTAGSAAVWQWGEAALTDDQGEPKQTGFGIELWGSVTTQVTEWLAT